MIPCARSMTPRCGGVIRRNPRLFSHGRCPHLTLRSIDHPWTVVQPHVAVLSSRTRGLCNIHGSRQNAIERLKYLPWMVPGLTRVIRVPSMDVLRTRKRGRPILRAGFTNARVPSVHHPYLFSDAMARVATRAMAVARTHVQGLEATPFPSRTVHGCYHDRMPPSKRVDPDAARFGAIIQQLRLARGWTLAKFAQRSGMNATYLGVLERGGNMPSLQTIFELADIFNVEASELVRRVEQARRPAPPVTDPPAD